MNTLVDGVPEDVGLSGERLRRIVPLLRGYLDRRAFSGCSVLVARRGRVVFEHADGVMDWDTGQPLAHDALFRIYSMTKPITSVALMMLHEEGLIRLEHEVARYLPEFADPRVFEIGDANAYRTRHAERPMRVHDLLTHTSGLSYGFMHQHAVDALYRKARIDSAREDGLTLAEWTVRLAELPLLFSPGQRWNYSVSTDVCGRLVEVVAGMPLDRFFAERIFAPLAMHDTAFAVPDDKLHRLASCYERSPQGEIRKQDDGRASRYRGSCRFHSGGGGLVSTLHDYYRFCAMLLGGGRLDGARILSPTTIRLMTMNHLPGNRTMQEMGDSLFTESRMDGSGFGLGFATVIDPVRGMSTVTAGTFSWGGMASTYFWIDPREELVCVFMTQLMPSSSYPVRLQLQTLVHAAVEG